MLSCEKLGRYKIGQMIGSGGKGEVYIAHDEQLVRCCVESASARVLPARR